MEAENRPNAALINREWFDAASNVLSADQLGIVVVNACRYVFGLDMLAGMTQVQGAVMAMIKPALDSDISRYRERCARNAANARSGRQRVGASGTQSQQVGAIPTTTSTTTTTTTTTTTQSISPTESEQREKWLVYGYFWSVGSKDPKSELDAFWDYYESLGWKNNKGAQIVSKLAAARMWRRQFETGVTHDGSAVWFKAVQDCQKPDIRAFTAFMGAERQGDCVLVRLQCKSGFYEALMAAVPNLEKNLVTLWRTPAVRFGVAEIE